MSRIDALNQKVGEVKGIVVDNMQKVQMRGERIDELDERAALLRSGAKDFHKVGTEVRVNRQRAYKRWKRGCLITVILLIVAAILLGIVLAIVLPLTLKPSEAPTEEP